MTEKLCERFLLARRKYIAAQFSNLNAMQREAALTCFLQAQAAVKPLC